VSYGRAEHVGALKIFFSPPCYALFVFYRDRVFCHTRLPVGRVTQNDDALQVSSRNQLARRVVKCPRFGGGVVFWCGVVWCSLVWVGPRRKGFHPRSLFGGDFPCLSRCRDVRCDARCRCLTSECIH